MNSAKRLALGLAVLALSALVYGCATFTPDAPVQLKNVVFAKPGDTVTLFNGGSKIAREAFCLNTVVPVYRYEGGISGGISSISNTGVYRKEVGKVKITRELGHYYIAAVVVEGSIKSGDIAVQPQVGCLINVPEKK